MLYKNNFIKNQYYSNYDLINKYKLDNVYSVPKIQSLIFEFSFNNFFSSLETNSSQKDVENQIQAYSLLYFWSSNIPFIKNCKLKIVKTKSKELESNYILKVVFKNNEQINNFLITFFVENWLNLVSEDSSLLSYKSTNFNKNDTTLLNPERSNIRNFKLTIPLSSIFELNSFISSIIPNLNTKNTNLNFNVIVKIPDLISNNEKVFKNLPLFWISG